MAYRDEMIRTSRQTFVWTLSWASVAAGCGGPDASVSSSSYTTADAATSTSTGTSADTTDTTETTANSGDAATSTGEVPTLEIDCAEPPATAVGAVYSHKPVASGAVSAVVWSMANLPPGLSFNPVSGEIVGKATMAGSFDVEITATSLDQLGEQTCTVVVGEGFEIDLSSHTRPCIGPDDDLAMFVTGGVGDALACTTPGGSGGGSIPEGVTVDPDTCLIEGTIADGYGTWVWITRVEQAGAIAYVPYCMTQEVSPPGSYTISGDHSGALDNALEPAVVPFTAGAALDFGGMGDPIFRVEGPCGPNSCFYGVVFGAGPSPFGDLGIAPTTTLRDVNNAPIGLTHEFTATGDPVAESLEARPWALSINLRYCISTVASDCDGGDAIDANGMGTLRFGLIAVPTP